MVTNPLIVRILRGSISLNTFLVSLMVYHNPLKAFRALKQLVAIRQKGQKTDKVLKFAKSGNKFFLALNMPGWPSKAFNQFIRNELFRTDNKVNGSSNLQTVILGITNKCNLNCKHCSNWFSESENNEHDSDRLEQIVNKLESIGIHHIQFTGGEPLEVFDDLIRLIKVARAMDSWILTSGFGLTLSKAIRMKKAGLTGVNISLDHWNETEHNKFRGNSQSFSWVSNAVQNCKQAGLLISLSICTTREFTSKENLARFVELAKNWEVHFIRILEPKKSGKFANENIRLSGEQIAMLEKLYFTSRKVNIDKRTPIVMYLDLLQRDSCMGKGDRYLYIDENGFAHPCPFSFNKSGNILKDSIWSIEEKLSKAECINCIK
ncbi:MAG: radical SAM protein [Bacteroidales bacterium]|nr:radical SAM protein [Bacteroidales bacterium]MCD4770104.1 radical SAM protein [Bacteroidales bacterium]